MVVKNIKQIRIFFYALSVMALFVSTYCVYADDQALGKIVGLNKNQWSLKVVSSQQKVEDAFRGEKLFEGDSIETITGQSAVVRLEDQSEVFIGPSTRVTFTNWFSRDSQDRKIRNITLHGGMIKLSVQKIYSQHEPFVVSTKYGVAAVRGTEFVIETGIAGRLSRVRRLSPDQILVRKYEVEIHVLEGEVHFARNIEELSIPEKDTTLLAGETAVLRSNGETPQIKNRFEVADYRKYLWGAVPKIEVAVRKGMPNEQRAEIAMNPGPEKTPALDGAEKGRQIAGQSVGSVVEQELLKRKKIKHPGQDINKRRAAKLKPVESITESEGDSL